MPGAQGFRLANNKCRAEALRSQLAAFNTDIAGVTHYTGIEFLDVVRYCIAHELFHLLGGEDNYGPLTNPYSLFSNIVISPVELSQVNLKTRLGVTK
ncbi:MAG: hypothetical protein FWG50_11190 [Kiritimatiellaeota bacterium]|nr:hypothetical protein [Kiritimatiellota bacterium]